MGEEGSKDPFKGSVFCFFSRLCYRLVSEPVMRLHTASQDTQPQGKPLRKQTPPRSIAHVARDLARDLARAKTQTHGAVRPTRNPD